MGPTGTQPGAVVDKTINACNQTLTYMLADLAVAPSYLPWLVPLAVAHVTMMRERVLFGPQLYCNRTANQSGAVGGSYSYPCQAPAPAQPSWLQTLVDQYTYYQSLFSVLVPQWRQWRAALIHNATSTSSWTVTDTLTNISITDGALATTSNECLRCV